MGTNYKKEADIHFAARVKLFAENERLRAALLEIKARAMDGSQKRKDDYIILAAIGIMAEASLEQKGDSR